MGFVSDTRQAPGPTAPSCGGKAAWAVGGLLALLTLLLLSVRHADLRLSSLPSWRRSPVLTSDLLIPRHPAVPPGEPLVYDPPLPIAGMLLDASVLLEREFLFSGPELDRAISLGDSRRLRHQVARLMAGEHVRVTVVGASITSGAGGRDWNNTRTAWPGYVSQFADWLAAAFPLSNASVANAGLAGISSNVYNQCFDSLVPAADIYILEQTTFDGTEPEKCDCKNHYVNTPVQLGIERLIRRILKQPHCPAVIMLNSYSFRYPHGGMYQRSVENQVQVMAQFYGLPVASMRAAGWQRMLQGGNGFDVTRTVVLYDGEVPKDKLPLYFDQAHPWGPTGHRMLAELLMRTVQVTAVGLSIQPLAASELQEIPEPLLPPLQDEFHMLVDKTKGFEWINERPEAQEKKAQKWGYVATAPGNWLEFGIDTRIAGSPAATNRVVLSYLASYEFMGIARVRCVSGCKCEDMEVDGLWEEHASVLQTAEFKVMVLPAGTTEFSTMFRLGAAQKMDVMEHMVHRGR